MRAHLVAGIVVAAVFGGCSRHHDEAEEEPHAWTESMLYRAAYTSTQNEGLLYLKFPSAEKSNWVAVKIGSTDLEVGYSLPVWYWSIDPRGLLVLRDDDGRRCAELELLRYSESEVTVGYEGGRIRYLRSTK